MSNNTLDTEARIIEAANKVFLSNGVDGTTMLQIADEANISRTSLHYYFRNKERLFQKVLETIKAKIIPTLSEIIDADETILTKIKMFVDVYIDLIIENPAVPGFLFMEMQRDSKWIVNFFKSQTLNFDMLTIQIKNEILKGEIKQFKIEDLLANTIGLSVFPILGKPFFMEFLFNHNENEFHEFMMSRKRVIISVLENWLKPD